MAYNLYDVSLSKAWTQRLDRERMVQDKFWMQQAEREHQEQLQQSRPVPRKPSSICSVRSSTTCASTSAASACPTGFTSTTSFLKGKLDQLEAQLQQERQRRIQLEENLACIKASGSSGGAQSSSSSSQRPHTPTAGKAAGTEKHMTEGT